MPQSRVIATCPHSSFTQRVRDSALWPASCPAKPIVRSAMAASGASSSRPVPREGPSSRSKKPGKRGPRRATSPSRKKTARASRAARGRGAAPGGAAGDWGTGQGGRQAWQGPLPHRPPTIVGVVALKRRRYGRYPTTNANSERHVLITFLSGFVTDVCRRPPWARAPSPRARRGCARRNAAPPA